MAILRPINLRQRGAWSVVGGGTVLQALTDDDDATGVLLNPAQAGDGAVVQLTPGGVPAEGDLTLRIRGRRIGSPLTVEYGIATQDVGDSDIEVVTREEVQIPNALATLTKTWDAKWQARLIDMSNAWFAIRVLSAGATSQLAIAEISLEVGDDPVGAWNDDLDAAPDDTLVWCRMGDGRARQGRRVAGEWRDASGDPLESDASMFAENVEGLREASRWVTGWGNV